MIAKFCENEISLDDCKNALFSMKLNKSPGSDGLSVEFYQAFCDNLKVYFYNSLKETYQNGYMSETQRKGILSLIFKKGDPTNLSNWRPLTLLNVDYKIIARVLAFRLQTIIPKINSTDQNGFIKIDLLV